jgi:hypothetical protein
MSFKCHNTISRYQYWLVGINFSTPYLNMFN